MVCLGLEPGAAVWKVQKNPLSYGGTPQRTRVRLVGKLEKFLVVFISQCTRLDWKIKKMSSYLYITMQVD